MKLHTYLKFMLFVNNLYADYLYTLAFWNFEMYLLIKHLNIGVCFFVGDDDGL